MLLSILKGIDRNSSSNLLHFILLDVLKKYKDAMKEFVCATTLSDRPKVEVHNCYFLIVLCKAKIIYLLCFYGFIWTLKFQRPKGPHEVISTYFKDRLSGKFALLMT